MPGRVSDTERLTQRFMVNCTEEQYRIVLEEAEHEDIQPGIVARRAFTMGLTDLRKKRLAVRRQTQYAKRKTQNDSKNS